MAGLTPSSREERLPLTRRLLALSVVVVGRQVDRLLLRSGPTASPPRVDAHEVGADDEIHLPAHVSPSGQGLLQAAQVLSFATSGLLKCMLAGPSQPQHSRT